MVAFYHRICPGSLQFSDFFFFFLSGASGWGSWRGVIAPGKSAWVWICIETLCNRPWEKSEVSWSGLEGQRGSALAEGAAGKPTQLCFTLTVNGNSWISGKHTRCVRTDTHTGRHVSDSITALWDEGEILQPSALPIKVCLWGDGRGAVCGYAAWRARAWVCRSGTFRCLSVHACMWVCVFNKRGVCVFVWMRVWVLLWWCFTVRTTEAWLVKCVCVRARPSDVTLYHFRLVSQFLWVRRKNKRQSERSEKSPQSSNDAEIKRLDQRTSGQPMSEFFQEKIRKRQTKGAGLTVPLKCCDSGFPCRLLSELGWKNSDVTRFELEPLLN